MSRREEFTPPDPKHKTDEECYDPVAGNHRGIKIIALATAILATRFLPSGNSIDKSDRKLTISTNTTISAVNTSSTNLP